MKMMLSFLLLALINMQNGISAEPCFDSDAIRLVQTRSITLENAGRVEICANGEWGTITAGFSPWSEKNAQVACIELGFSGALNAIIQKTIPLTDHADSSVPVHLVGFTCDGEEGSISQCFRSTTSGNISHKFDAYIVCRPNGTMRYSDVHVGGPHDGDVRLFASQVNSNGAVQIYSSANGWQGICPDSSWTDSDADTICKHLGYAGGDIVSPVAAVGGEPISRRLYNTNCPAKPNSPNRYGVCSFSVGTSDTSNCNQPSGLYAALSCISMGGNIPRLIGGDDSRSGIVEMSFNGRYGMVCDDGFSHAAALVICRSVVGGSDSVKVMKLTPLSPILRSESNLKPIWLTQLMCTAGSSMLGCIENNIIGYANCSTSNIAAVDCGNPPGLSDEAITGITLGVIAFIFIIVASILIAVCCAYVLTKRRQQRNQQTSLTCTSDLSLDEQLVPGHSNTSTTNTDLPPQHPEKPEQ